MKRVGCRKNTGHMQQNTCRMNNHRRMQIKKKIQIYIYKTNFYGYFIQKHMYLSILYFIYIYFINKSNFNPPSLVLPFFYLLPI